jgi:hypothetical protein
VGKLVGGIVHVGEAGGGGPLGVRDGLSVGKRVGNAVTSVGANVG